MGKIGQARGFLFFRIVNKFFFRKRKKNKNGLIPPYCICMFRNNDCHNEEEGCFNQDIYQSIHVMLLDLDLNDYDY